MDEEFFGVFFEDSGSEYLVAAFDTEMEATRWADEREQERYAEEADKHEAEPDEFDEPGTDRVYYVEPISRELADRGRRLPERNLAIRVTTE